MWIVLIGFASGVASAMPSGACRDGDSRTGRYDVTGITQVILKTHHGSKQVTAKPDSDTTRTLTFEGVACAPDPQQRAAIQVTEQRHGDRLTLEVVLPPVAETSPEHAEALPVYFNSRFFVPTELGVQIIDGLGSLTVEKLTHVVIADQQGDVTLQHIRGNVVITGHSGDLRMDDIQGNVTVRWQAGEVRIQQVGANLVLSGHDAGALILRDVGGNVVIQSHGMGDVSLERIGGHVILATDAGGDVQYRDIAGHVMMPGTIRREGSPSQAPVLPQR